MANLLRILYCLARARGRLRWDNAKLRHYQDRHFRQVIRYAWAHVPFYREKFKKAGIDLDRIRTIADLGKIPITRKEELRRQPKIDIVSDEFLSRKLRTVTTSGSTGTPLTVYMTRKEDDWRKAIYLRANSFCGQKPRDKWAVIIGPNHFSEITSLQKALGFYARTCISVFDDTGTQLSRIEKIKPDILDGYSSSVMLLAREMEKMGSKLPRPRIVFGNAEVISNASRKYIEDVFQSPYYDQYGCAEFNRTAWQCPEQVGYHMDEDSVIAQIVDENGNEVSTGKRGEIIYTSLFNFAMPFIRYEVGDLGVRSDEKCPCGVTLPLMKSVEGRKDSLIVLPDGQTLSPRMFTVATSMYKHYQSIEQFRFVQKELGLIEIQIKTRDNVEDKNMIETEFVTHLNSTLDLQKHAIRFNVKFVDDIPIDKSGKLMTVVSEIQSGS